MADNNLEFLVGQLVGRVDALKDAVETQGDQASESRRRLYDGQEKLRAEVQSLGTRMETVEKTVSGMEPLVGRVGRLMERWRGVVLVVALIWLLFGGLVLDALRWAATALWHIVTGG